MSWELAEGYAVHTIASNLLQVQDQLHQNHDFALDLNIVDLSENFA